MVVEIVGFFAQLFDVFVPTLCYCFGGSDCFVERVNFLAVPLYVPDIFCVK